jgi:hypothetical protein
MSKGLEMSWLTQEIDNLNERYAKELKDKVGVYSELSRGSQEVTQVTEETWARETERMRLKAESSIHKRELE